MGPATANFIAICVALHDMYACMSLSLSGGVKADSYYYNYKYNCASVTI